MLVVFGYTKVLVIKQYLEVVVFNKTVLGVFLLGLIIELLMAFDILEDEKVDIVFNGLGDWMTYDTSDSGIFFHFSEAAVGIVALYSYGTWLVVVTGWSSLTGVAYRFIFQSRSTSMW